MIRTRQLAIIGVAFCVATMHPHREGVADEWPQFRGVNAGGIADGQNLPDSWDVEAGTNLRWKTNIPGLGHASPIVSRGRVLILSADNGESKPELRLGLYGDIESVEDDLPHEWRLYCMRQSTGDVLWRRTLHRGVPAIKRHTKGTHANSTPATDGQRIVAFLGSEGLYCLDFCGNVLWKRDLGELDSGYFRVRSAQWGFASSPIIYRGMVIVQCDVQDDSFLAALDICNGREIWRVSRDDVPTWSTPAIVEGPRRTELVVNGFRHAGGYDPLTGEAFWKLSGGGDIPVPTPIHGHGLIFLSSAHGRNRPLCAVKLGADGDLTPGQGNSHESLVWYQRRSGIYMQTPLVYGDYLYACQGNGVLSCYDARTGDRQYQQRIGQGNGFTASPVAADGKLYFSSEDGVVSVVAVGPEYKLLATNQMGDSCMATPAIADGALFIRTQEALHAIGKPVEPSWSVLRSAPTPRRRGTRQRLRSRGGRVRWLLSH